MKTILAIAAGGAIGAVLRHALNSGVMRLLGGDFPWGILLVNTLGSFVMGVLIAAFAQIGNPPQAMRAFLTVGVLGAFTTFSTFSLDTALLIERGAPGAAMLYVGASVLLGVGALFAGMALTRAVLA